MRDVLPPGGRAGFGAAAFLSCMALVACATPAPSFRPQQTSPLILTAPPSTDPPPWSPTEFATELIEPDFPTVTALTSTGERLYWASGSSIWGYVPGELRAERLYASGTRGAVVWDIAAVDDTILFAERLPEPAGRWRVAVIGRTGAVPVDVDSGLAKGGAPPTVAIDGRRLAWVGFDETSGEPRAFLRVADRSDPTITTLFESDIDDALLWYPQLDENTLWYAKIDPDFEGTGAGDAFHIESLDLETPSSAPVTFAGLELAFEPSVTPAYIAWKSVDRGFSALTWGEIGVLDRRSGQRFVIAAQTNHPSVGSSFVTFEEFFHERLVVYDLATHRSIEIPDPLHGAKGTIGVPVVAGDLLGYTASVGGASRVYWTRLPA